MEGYAIKRPYQGEWEPSPGSEKRPRPHAPHDFWGQGPSPLPPQGPALRPPGPPQGPPLGSPPPQRSYPPDYSDYGAGSYGSSMYYSSGYNKMVYGGFSEDYGNTGWGSGASPSDTSADNALDFTDDYDAFYGKANSADKRRGFSKGHGQGQMRGNNNWGSFNKPIAQQNNRSPQMRGGYQGNRGGGNKQRGANNQMGQKGMPPNQRGQGRGRGNAKKKSAAQPVQSQPKAKPSFPDIVNMSAPEKLHRFCLYLRSDNSIKTNAVQTIMNAITSSKLGIMVGYEAEELAKVAKRVMYTGVLKLDNVFLARSVGPNKKELKQDVFVKALNVMLTKTVAEIYMLSDPGPEAIKKELMEQLEAENTKAASETGSSNAKSILGTDLHSSLAQWANTIKNMTNRPDSAISLIEQAVNQGHCVIRHQYTVDKITQPSGRCVYVGKISFGNIVIGQGNALSKKAARAVTYDKTLVNIMNKSLRELQVSVPEEKLQDIEKEVPANKKGSSVSLPFEERFSELIRSLVTKSNQAGNINPLDQSALLNGITPLVLFRATGQTGRRDILQCELYLEKIFISSGEGTRKKCMTAVYKAAWEILTTTDAETILTQHKRITDEDLKDPQIVDMIVKGGGKTTESNTESLNRYGFDLSTLSDHKLEDLVIVEHNDWAKERSKHAFCILQFSCTTNGMLLQWEMEPQTGGKKGLTLVKCTMFIQKQPVGMSYGTNRSQAKSLAAVDTLFNLYEKQPVVKITIRNDENAWIPWETIEKEVEEMKTKNIGEEPVLKTDEYGKPLPDIFIMKVLTEKLNAFVEKKEGELIFGPGMGIIEGRELRKLARTFNLKCDTRQHKGESYLLFYEKLGWPELVQNLRKTNGPFGKYRLVPEEELPKYAEIENTIIKSPSLTAKDPEVVVEVKIDDDI